MNGAMVADAINYEYQSRSSAESVAVLISLATRIADSLDDPRDRRYFLEIASMGGLPVSPDGEHAA